MNFVGYSEEIVLNDDGTTADYTQYKMQFEE